MTLVLADRVRETSNTAGSGPFTLAGAPQGYQTLSAGIGNANSSYFVAWDGAANWLVFSGTYTGGTNSVSVDSTLAQSAGFAGFPGAKTIWCDAPATLVSPLLQMSASAAGVQVTSALGIGMVPVNLVDAQKSQNAPTAIAVSNSSTASAARADVRIGNSNSTFYLINFGTGYTPSGMARADGQMINSGGPGGLTLVTNIAQPIYFGTNNVEVARFDAAGNFGIGMVPVNTIDVTKNFNGDLVCKMLNTNAGANAEVDFIVHNGAVAGYFGVPGTGATGLGVLQPSVPYLRSSGELAIAGNIIHFSSGTPGNNFAEVARFDATGRLGIGVVPAYILHVSQNINNSAWGYIANPSTGNNANSGWLASNGTSIAYTFMMSTGYSSGAPFRADGGGLFCNGAGGLSLGTTISQPIYFFTNGVEQGRFASNGALILQGTTVVAAYPSDLTCHFAGNSLSGIVTNDTNAAAGIDNAMVFVRNTVSVGSIQTTLTGTQFQPTSDKNLKTLDEDRIDSGPLIDAVSPHWFHWNSTGERDYGFFAQEVYAALGGDIANHPARKGSPDEDFGTEDYKVWGLDMSKLVPILWAEIQSLRARMAQVEGTH